MAIKILNLKTVEPADVAGLEDDHIVYVGRAMPRQRLKASPLANPYTLKEWGRDGALSQYRAHLERMTFFETGREAREILRIAGLARTGDVALTCWCHPEPCHAEIIREWVEAELTGQSKFRRP